MLRQPYFHAQKGLISGGFHARKKRERGQSLDISPDVGEDEDEEGDDDSDVDKHTEEFWPVLCPLLSSEEGHEVVVNQVGKFAAKNN